MKRIAIWGYSSNYGGIECLVFSVYKNINREKIQFDFLVSHNYGEIAFEDEILSMGGRIFRILYSERESVIKSRTCWLKFFKEHPEVVGIHVHANFPYAFPLVMAKKAGISMRILHSHSCNITSGRNMLIMKVREKKVEREINISPTSYLACSEAAAKFMFPNKPYTWIKNGIEIDKFDYNEEIRNRVREKYNISKDEIILGTVGRLDIEKNPLYTIEVFNEYIKLNSKAKLVIIGEGSLRTEMEEKLEQYGIRDRVIFTGVIKDTSEWYQAMDLFLFPSKFEGLGIVLIEAQVSGLPCLASKGVPRVAKITELVQYQSIDSEPYIWANKIEQMISDNRNARRSYKKEVINEGYDIKQIAKQLEDKYCN